MKKYQNIFLIPFAALLMFGCISVFSQNKNEMTLKQADSISNAAELKKYPRYKFSLYSGGLFSDLDGSIIVNGKTTNIGTKLDFEDNLGLTNYITTYRLEGMYNISRKSTVSAYFLVMNRSSDITLSDSIKFGDNVYRANARFGFLLNFTYIGLNYGYNFVAKPQFTTGATIGLRLFRIRTSGIGTVTVNNSTAEKSFESTLFAPGALIGLNNSVYFLPNLFARSSLEYFSIKIGDIKAGLFEAKIGMEYYFLKNIGVGVMVLANVLKITSVSQTDFKGEVSYNFRGLSLYLAARF